MTGIEEPADSDLTRRRIHRLEEATRKSAFWCEEKDYFYHLDREEPDIILLMFPLIVVPLKSSDNVRMTKCPHFLSSLFSLKIFETLNN